MRFNSNLFLTYTMYLLGFYKCSNYYHYTTNHLKLTGIKQKPFDFAPRFCEPGIHKGHIKGGLSLLHEVCGLMVEFQRLGVSLGVTQELGLASSKSYMVYSLTFLVTGLEKLKG